MSLDINKIGSDGEKKMQELFETREDALKFYNNQMLDYLAPLMQEFILSQEMMFISTADSKGECDSSFRAGEKGFVTILDKNYLLFPEYRGNGVMASMGNISENGHVGLLFLDFFETKVGLHVNGRAKVIAKEHLEEALIPFSGTYDILKNEKDRFKIVSYILVEVEEAYIHCSIHIPILKRVDEKDYLGKFPKYSKGGDAFSVVDRKRNWL